MSDFFFLGGVFFFLGGVIFLNFFSGVVVELYYYLFNINSFIPTIFCVSGGSVSVGRCALFVFGEQQVAE